MKQGRRTVALSIVLALCLGFAAAGWGVHRVVSWCVDLPNRIHVTIDGEALRRFWIDRSRDALMSSDPQLQLQGLIALEDAFQADPSAPAIVRAEFAEELQALCASPDPMIAGRASALLAQ